LSELDEMLWKNDADLDAKIEFYLRHGVEREFIASKVRQHILANHAWENRAELILKSVAI
jgi:spore maturation protein CgeB